MKIATCCWVDFLSSHNIVLRKHVPIPQLNFLKVIRSHFGCNILTYRVIRRLMIRFAFQIAAKVIVVIWCHANIDCCHKTDDERWQTHVGRFQFAVVTVVKQQLFGHDASSATRFVYILTLRFYMLTANTLMRCKLAVAAIQRLEIDIATTHKHFDMNMRQPVVRSWLYWLCLDSKSVKQHDNRCVMSPKQCKRCWMSDEWHDLAHEEVINL